MKTIEELKMDNIVLIEKYLNGRLDPAGEQAFLAKVKADSDLQTDFNMVLEAFPQHRNKKQRDWLSRWQDAYPMEESSPQFARKAGMANAFVKLALLASAGAFMLLLICAMMLAFIG